MMTIPRAPRIAAGVVGVVFGIAAITSGQVLETETARPLAKGTFELGGNLEVQTSSEGRELDVPLVVAYGLTNQLELLIEPVASSLIAPTFGAHAHGVGDTEVTTLWRLRPEAGGWPAFTVGGEVKVPTAESRLIGTGKVDVAGILIASRRLGRVDTHANLTYTFVGQPAGASLTNIIGGAFAVEAAVGRRYRIFSEVLASTGATPGGEGDALPGTTIVQEAAGQEIVGTIGAGVYVHQRHVFLSLGVSYDNNRAILLRPGVTFLTK
jgi:hypothetical protein